MKTEDFLEALSNIDDKYVEETLHYRKSPTALKVWRAVAIAACAVLAVTGVLALSSINPGGLQKNDTVYYREEAAPDAYYEEAAAGDYAYEYEEYEDAMEPVYEESYDEGYLNSNENYGALMAMADRDDVSALAPQAMKSETAEETTRAAAEQGMAPKIIYTVNLDIQTKEFDDAVRRMQEVTSSVGGYFESQNLYNNTGSYRSAMYVIRIPSEQLDSFLDQVEQISTVTFSSKSAEDISEQYYDTQSRLDTAKTKLERLQELLKDAENMEDIITIESAISDTEWEIDNYSGTMRYFDSQVNYSTVSVNLEEVYEVVVEEQPPMTFGDRLSRSFGQGIQGLKNFGKNFLIFIAGNWIVLAIIAAVIVAAVLIIRAAVKRKRR